MPAKRRVRQLTISARRCFPGHRPRPGRGARTRRPGDPARPGAPGRHHPAHRRQGAAAPAAVARRCRWSSPAGAAPPSRSCRSAATSTSSPATSTTWSAPARPRPVQRLGAPADGLRRRQGAQPAADRAAPDGQAAAGPGRGLLRPVRELASLRATAVRQPRTAAARLGAALAGTGTAGSRDHRGARRGAPGVAGPPLPGHRPRPQPHPDRRPAAWSAGLTGEGSGWRCSTPASTPPTPTCGQQGGGRADFSGSGSTTDRAGHGTHVASIVAGTGARSGGERRVAFEASLLNGKVLDDFGFGSESGIIAGMEWAAARRARVANMSLGGWRPTAPT